MNYKAPLQLVMKERSLSSSSQGQGQHHLRPFRNSISNGMNGNFEHPLIDEELNENAVDNEIDSPNLLATSVENNSLLSSNSTISLLSLNRSSMSRNASFSNNTNLVGSPTQMPLSGSSAINIVGPGSSAGSSTTFTNPIMFQRVNLRRYSSTNNANGSGNNGGVNITPMTPLSIDTVPETPNLDPVSIQNSPSNFWLNRPMMKRQSSVTNQMNVQSPFLYPVRDHDGNVTPLILSPQRNELKE